MIFLWNKEENELCMCSLYRKWFTVVEEGDTVVDHTGASSVERTDHECDVTSCSIPAHRVIIAARCDWFKRALLSGMRESIDRFVTRIHICQMSDLWCGIIHYY